MDDPSVPQPPRAKGNHGRHRWLLYLGLGVLLGAAALGFAAWFFVPGQIRDEIVQRARQRGFVIDPTELSWRGDEVVLSRVPFSLVGVEGVRGQAETVRIGLSGLEPNSVQVEGLYLRTDTSIADLGLSLSAWSQRYASSYSLPISVSKITLHSFSAGDSNPWLLIEGGTLTRSGDSQLFDAKRLRFQGAELGAVGARFDVDTAHVAFALGEQELEQAPIGALLHHTANPPTVEITVTPTELTALGAPLGLALPLEGVLASGVVHLELPQPDPMHGAISGSASIALKGYIPPHPPELQGFVFGDVTELQTSFIVDENRTNVALQDLRVIAGSFGLKGSGSIVRETSHATLHFDLAGKLPCAALAGAAAESKLGRVVGKWIGQRATELVQGNVTISLQIRADTRELDKAEVLKQISPGCGLKPVTIPGLGSFRMPQLPKLPKELPKLPPPPDWSLKLPKLQLPKAP